MNKHMFLIGGIGLAGIVVLVLIMRESSSGSAAASQSLPQQAEVPSSAPTYPAPPPLPPFTVNATPYYLTFNVPPNRNAAVEQDATVKKDGCCTDCEDAGTVVLRQSFLNRNAANARRAFQSGPNSGSMMTQFPQYLYPWLYQKGGTA